MSIVSRLRCCPSSLEHTLHTHTHTKKKKKIHESDRWTRDSYVCHSAYIHTLSPHFTCRLAKSIWLRNRRRVIKPLCVALLGNFIRDDYSFIYTGQLRRKYRLYARVRAEVISAFNSTHSRAYSPYRIVAGKKKKHIGVYMV